MRNTHSILPRRLTNPQVQAVTGSGKTLSFLIPIITRLLGVESSKKHRFQALIVAPTRELAVQIHSVLIQILQFHSSPSTGQYEHNRIIPQLVARGRTEAQDLSAFLSDSPNLLIGTPGRIRKLLASPHVHASATEVLVLDEADKLLAPNFEPDMAAILAFLPKQRRTGLFSASMDDSTQLYRTGLRNPVRVSVKVKTTSSQSKTEDLRRTPASLQLHYVLAKPVDRLQLTLELLGAMQQAADGNKRAIVFFSTCAAVEYFRHIYPVLLPIDFLVASLHGKQSAQVREKNLDSFSQSVQRPAVLLATDVAARGLDISNVDLVIQETPTDAQEFLHRSGRTGRAGRMGRSVIFLMAGTKEEDFVGLLAAKRTPITPLEMDPPDNDNAQALVDKVRRHVLHDRALYDKAQRGFVSYVQAYKKSSLSSIFDMANFNNIWTQLADSWGLLRIPSMPELRAWKGDRTLGQGHIDWDRYAYKNKMQERSRRGALEAQEGPKGLRTRPAVKRTTRSVPWSRAQEQRQKTIAKRETRQARKLLVRRGNMTEEEIGKEADLKLLINQVRREVAVQNNNK